MNAASSARANHPIILLQRKLAVLLWPDDVAFAGMGTAAWAFGFSCYGLVVAAAVWFCVALYRRRTTSESLDPPE